MASEEDEYALDHSWTVQGGAFTSKVTTGIWASSAQAVYGPRHALHEFLKDILR